ncbi:anaphase-promoting complex component apc8 [Mortierella sp. NVP85]|nr:anaphase-promoting complex component apc8 [Mortierella sp. NVP85]
MSEGLTLQRAGNKTDSLLPDCLDNAQDAVEITDPSSEGQGLSLTYLRDLALNSDVWNGSDTRKHRAYLKEKLHFNSKHYEQCAATLKGYNSRKSRFLRLYPKYLAWEKRHEDSDDEFAPLEGNQELGGIDSKLTEAYKAGTLDSFGKYLYGVVLIKRQQKDSAVAKLVESVNQYPYNWSAWLELGSYLSSNTEVRGFLTWASVDFMAPQDV